MIRPTRMLTKMLFLTLLGLAPICCLAGFAFAQGGSSPPYVESGDSGVLPGSYQGSGSFFNRQLGTVFRFNYNSQGYGTQDDVVSLGSMKVFNLDEATIFIDGQATLSDDFGGGFNLGLGYRELVNTGISFDPQRIHGVSLWTDGQSSSGDNFFTQLGFSLESLGESFDARFNAHFPLERSQRGDPRLTSIDTLTFGANELFSGLENVVVDTAYAVVDGELAKRINNLEAWAFLGGYHIGGGGVDTVGYRAGVRGYATPDFAVSLQVTDDDFYNTNVMVGLTWFVGRTHRGNQPLGNIYDRFREPVLRNNFIAMSSRTVTQAAGNALSDTDGEQLRFVHVGTSTAGTGDGTLENPFDTMTLASADATERDIVFVHGGKTLSDGFVAKNDQRILGEGLSGALVDPQPIAHIVDTLERGLVTLPESSVGASMLAAPTISGAGITAFTLADDNTVNNFIIDTVGTAVSAIMIDSPTLSNLRIANTSGDAIFLNEVTGTTVVDNTVTIIGAADAAIRVNGGLDGMSIAAGITNTAGSAFTVENRTGGTITYSGTIDDDGGLGISLIDNDSSTVLLTNASTDLTNGIDIMAPAGDAITITGNTASIFEFTGTVGVDATGANNGIVIANNDAATGVLFGNLDATAVDGNTISIEGGAAATTSGGAGIILSSADDTRTIENTGNGTAVRILGDLAEDDDNATVTINSNVENTGGGLAVDLQNRRANNVTFTGTVDANTGGGGILAQNNTSGGLFFNSAVTLDTATNNGVTLTNNTDATFGFNGLQITTTTGTGFEATGGAELVVSSPSNTNSIDTTTGVALNLNGVTVEALGVTFDTIDVTNGATSAITLTNIDGDGSVTLGSGTDPADGGTLVTAGTAIEVSDVNALVVNNITVNNAGGAAGVNVTLQEAASTAVFNGLTVTTVNGDAVTVDANLDGAITFNDLNATTTGTGDAVVLTNNADATVTINGMEATATGSGRAFTATGGGNLVATGTNNLTSATGIGLELDGIEIAGAGAGFTTVNVSNGATQAIRLQDLTGTALTIGTGTNPADGGTLVSNGTAIVVDNSINVTFNNLLVDNDAFAGRGAGIDVLNNDAGTIAFNGVEVQTFDDDAVTLRQNDGGSVTFTDLVANVAVGTAANTAIRVENNTSGNFSFNNSDIDTTLARGVLVNNNGTATTAFAAFSLNTTTGDGFTATGTGTLAASGTNTITTTTGVGLTLDGVTIAGSGASFSSVSVNGAVNGVVLNNLIGGQVTVGSTATASTLNDTSGDAIQLTNTANVNLVNIDVTASTGGAGLNVINDNANAMDVNVNDLTVDSGVADGILAVHTGGGNFTLLVDNSDINSTVNIDANGAGDIDLTFEDTDIDTTGTDVAFTLAIDAAVTEADVRILRNGITSADATALDIDITSVASKTVNLEIDGNTVANSSANVAADIDASQSTILNATVIDNFFNNAGAGGDYEIASNSATTVINLHLHNNTTGGGAGSFTLREIGASDFNIQERDTVEARNTSGGFVFDSAGNVVTDFDNIISVPLP